MTKLCYDVLSRLRGKTLATAESLTGGGIGAALTAVPGSSSVYAGGVISYTDQAKAQLLGVPRDLLEFWGAVSPYTAEAMAKGARKLLQTDVAISVTGLAGPDGDEFGNPVGTVCIGYSDKIRTIARTYHFSGDRDAVRQQTIRTALEMILEQQR